MGDNRVPDESDEEQMQEEDPVRAELEALRKKVADSSAKQKVHNQRFRAKKKELKEAQQARDARRREILTAIRQRRNPQADLYA